MKKVLVTGATGFIGNYVIAALLQHNYHVIATSTSVKKAVKMPWFNQVSYVEFNFQNFNEQINYVDFFNKPDFIIHLAWEGLPNYTNDFHLIENYPRHLALLKNMLQNGLTNITVSGTCFEYGMQQGQLNEEMASRPLNAYALAKDELRKSLQILCELKSVSLKWIRLFYMYGAGQHPNSLISQLDKALAQGQQIFNMSGGEQERDFLPVQIVAEYIVAIATQNNITGIINCCSGNPIKIKDFIAAYLNIKQKTIKLNLGYYPYVDYEPMSFWGDTQKLQLILKKT